MTETAGEYTVDHIEASLNAAVECNRLKPGSAYKTWLKDVYGIVPGEKFAIVLVNDDKPDTGLFVPVDRQWEKWDLPHRDQLDREIAFHSADEFIAIVCIRIHELASINKPELT
jgi:hypothetical protein